jgi:hypothetical protein
MEGAPTQRFLVLASYVILYLLPTLLLDTHHGLAIPTDSIWHNRLPSAPPGETSSSPPPAPLHRQYLDLASPLAAQPPPVLPNASPQTNVFIRGLLAF